VAVIHLPREWKWLKHRMLQRKATGGKTAVSKHGNNGMWQPGQGRSVHLAINRAYISMRERSARSSKSLNGFVDLTENNVFLGRR